MNLKFPILSAILFIQCSCYSENVGKTLSKQNFSKGTQSPINDTEISHYNIEAYYFGKKPKRGRVVGGKVTSIEDHPYIVSVQYHHDHICGGGIISSNFILTAAHCFISKNKTKIAIRAGSTYQNKDGIFIPACMVTSHEHFDKETFDNDIALIKLCKPLPKTKLTTEIQPYFSDVSNLSGFGATIVGWGSENFRGPITSSLREAIVNVMEFEDCKLIYKKELTNSMFCAFDKDGRDACQGDSGGPLVIGNELVGVVSWGTGCGDIKHPGVYTNVALFRKWIEKNLLYRSKRKYYHSNNDEILEK